MTLIALDPRSPVTGGISHEEQLQRFAEPIAEKVAAVSLGLSTEAISSIAVYALPTELMEWCLFRSFLPKLIVPCPMPPNKAYKILFDPSCKEKRKAYFEDNYLYYDLDWLKRSDSKGPWISRLRPKPAAVDDGKAREELAESS